LELSEEIRRRRTFAIISHPDAGKTTLTEKLLLFGGAIQMAGTVKGRKATRHATSDWMRLEQQRGISVTSSVMQFPFRDCIVNLLDTPGHEDFSEDTYRTLTAVDSALMVIDCAKGVEQRTVKLMEVCRLRDTPIITFINKLDREGRPPIELLDEIEEVLKIRTAPVTWPIGMGQRLKGVYHIPQDRIYAYQPAAKGRMGENLIIDGLTSDAARAFLGADADAFVAEVELVQGATDSFSLDAYNAGKQTPVFFGSAINNFGVEELLAAFAENAPGPLPRATRERLVEAQEPKLTGFVFKIQANMDPSHRDRIAFLRVASGHFERGMRLKVVRSGKELRPNTVVSFLSQRRELLDEAFAGDIIGIPNHGVLQLGDTLTEGEALQFTGLPFFAPELFRTVEVADPLKTKQLRAGLTQLGEEGAIQVFRPVLGTVLLLGAVGQLQFEVVAHRLEHEYGVRARILPARYALARWITCEPDDGGDRELQRFIDANAHRIAYDAVAAPAILVEYAPELRAVEANWPKIKFHALREHAGLVFQKRMGD
jgi:peptide chain release factor 3